MATHNGAAFLKDQVDSILRQQDVDLRLIVSDDASSDGTPSLLQEYARDPRIVVLPPGTFGSAQANFYRLITEAPTDGAAAIAFADQDDVWLPGKLSAQLAQLASNDAVSSNVTATFGDRRVTLDKAQPQRALDFVCESAGPGCTYLLSPTAFTAVREVVRHDPRVAGTAAHDWLIYAIVRASGLRWHIDDAATVDYRQHASNVIGANLGPRQARIRLGRIRSGGFRLDCALTAEIAADVADGDQAAALHRIAQLLRDRRLRSRSALARQVSRLRRRRRDRVLLRAVTLAGLW